MQTMVTSRTLGFCTRNSFYVIKRTTAGEAALTCISGTFEGDVICLDENQFWSIWNQITVGEQVEIREETSYGTRLVFRTSRVTELMKVTK